jgi:hypothetical protein
MQAMFRRLDRALAKQAQQREEPDGAPPLSSESSGPPVDWLLDLLREAIEELMDSDAAPLQKANAIARLGSLYLKGFQVGELRRANAELERRVAELEQRAAAAEAQAAQLAAGLTEAAFPLEEAVPNLGETTIGTGLPPRSAPRTALFARNGQLAAALQGADRAPP